VLIKRVESIAPVGPLAYAWRSRGAGRALRWFVKRLEDATLRRELLAG
jgi:hypothetical protein